MKYFGTDGFRGKANQELTAYHAFLVGQGYGMYLKQKQDKPWVFIGQDTRLSSGMLASSLASGFSSVGVSVKHLGVIATPAVSYLTSTSDASGAVMVSASHNPFEDNGLKLFNFEGEKVSEETELYVEAVIDQECDVTLCLSSEIGMIENSYEEIDRYLNYLHTHFPLDLSNKVIVLDCANGATVSSALKAFEQSNAEIFVYNTQWDGVNINHGVGSTHIDFLQKKVLEHKADIGFAFDGDGDRCIAVDGEGHQITGDHLLYLIANFLKKKNQLDPAVVVTTVMANLGLGIALKNKGIDITQTKVGDKYVYEEMVKNHGIIGGEQSGHIIYRKLARTGDGVLTALLVALIMDETKLSCEKLCEDLIIYPQLLKNLKVTDKEAVLKDIQINEFINQEAAKLHGEGRILVRPSGTEPLVRVMVEAKTQLMCEEIVDRVIEKIQSKGY